MLLTPLDERATQQLEFGAGIKSPLMVAVQEPKGSQLIPSGANILGLLTEVTNEQAASFCNCRT